MNNIFLNIYFQKKVIIKVAKIPLLFYINGDISM